MKKRAGLARALAARPAVLLADDPFAGLDPGTARQVARVLLEVAGKGTLLVAAPEAPVDLPLPLVVPARRPTGARWGPGAGARARAGRGPRMTPRFQHP